MFKADTSHAHLLLFATLLFSTPLFADEPNSIETEVEHYQAIKLVNQGHITSLDTHLTRLNLNCNLVDATLFQIGSKWRYDLHLMTFSGEAIFLEIDAKTSELYSPQTILIGCL